MCFWITHFLSSTLWEAKREKEEARGREGRWEGETGGGREMERERQEEGRARGWMERETECSSHV